MKFNRKYKNIIFFIENILFQYLLILKLIFFKSNQGYIHFEHIMRSSTCYLSKNGEVLLSFRPLAIRTDYKGCSNTFMVFSCAKVFILKTTCDVDLIH